ncbi:hypothetical protein ACFYXN_11440 [Streptomyces griseus]|uniref:hypothetical protein n=1 Tax=Streptomyces griseus TaxID=1911 RepID=UPI0036CC788F
MTLTDFPRRVTATDSDADAGSRVGAGAATGAEAAVASVPAEDAGAPAPRAAGREADGLAVASFVLSLLGLLVFNILLGPAAIVMALLALARRTGRPGRARLGLALGVADLAVLAALVAANGTVSWNLGG